MKTLDAQEHAHEEAFVTELASRIAAVLSGEADRATAKAWVRSVWPEGKRIPELRWSAAENVLCCTGDIDVTELVREQDLRAYLQLLRHGEFFDGDPEPLLSIAGRLDDVRGPRRGETERFIVDGLGWFEGLRFVSGATGMPYVASVQLRFDGAPYVNIVKRARDDALEAVWDLFELLHIDETDVAHLGLGVDVRRLPEWRLRRLDDNGQEFVVATSHSRSKLHDQQRAYEAKGHRQSYWLERA